MKHFFCFEALRTNIQPISSTINMAKYSAYIIGEKLTNYDRFLIFDKYLVQYMDSGIHIPQIMCIMIPLATTV